MSANKRTIMYVVIAVICVIAIIIAVYYQFFAEKVVTESQVNPTRWSWTVWTALSSSVKSWSMRSYYKKEWANLGEGFSFFLKGME